MEFTIHFGNQPDDWRRCFGLDDNPFSPNRDRNGLLLSKLGIEEKPLCPHSPNCEALFDRFFVKDVDRVLPSLQSFLDYSNSLGGGLLQHPPVILVHGPRGAGKSTFANVCRYLVRRNLPPTFSAFQCDLKLLAPGSDSLSVDEIVMRLFEQQAEQSGAAGAAANGESLTLVLLDDLGTNLLTRNGHDRNGAFLFVSYVRERLLAQCNPLLFVTSDSKDIVTAFANRAPGHATQAKSFQVDELSGEDVIKFVEHRLAIFRPQQDPPPAMPLFPFHEESIVKSFQDVKRQGRGSLPFRNVNRILASALRYKMQVLLKEKDALEKYVPALSAEELQRRVIDEKSLASAMQG